MVMRDDPSRIAELRRTGILDSSPQRAFDDLTRLLATALPVPIAMINILDEQRDWFKSRVGVESTQMPVATSFCEAFFSFPGDMIVVEDTLLDERFADHPLVVGAPQVRFYAAARLVVRGHTLGTLCAYDLQPRRLAAEQIDHLRAMASAAVELLSGRSPDLLAQATESVNSTIRSVEVR
jgi:GAF domain-containing protein